MSAEAERAAVGWLGRLAIEDEMTVAEAALVFVEAGVTSADWTLLTTAERAAILAARRDLTLRTRANALEDAGQDLMAARLRAPMDGGSQRARLMARAAAEGVSAALKRQRKEATMPEPNVDAVNGAIDEAFERAAWRSGHGVVR